MNPETIFLNAGHAAASDRAGAAQSALPSNPFVGLRPFESEESVLFFGRDAQIVELLRQLHRTRFLAVVGSSGCGKSSLIRAGLIPKLKAGFIVERRDRWKVVTMKPGDSPLNNLAAGLLEAAPGGGGDDPADFVKAMRVSGAKAVLERLAKPLERDGANLLLLVDQFEELFRYGGQASGVPAAAASGDAAADAERLRAEAVERIQRRDEATRFVSVMLDLARQSESPRQREAPVYVVMTMRSDFLGDCDAFRGLPEAINRSLYLVPRLDRERRQEAVEKPVRLYGRDITPRLLDRVVNDVGDEPDQLPVMQHALMRTWEEWKGDHGDGEPLDLRHYEAAGTFAGALSQDADRALEEMLPGDQLIAERMFQALVDTDAQGRRVRRPARLGELAEATGATPEKLLEVIDHFRRGGRCFLTLSSERAAGDTLVDISHESFIRQWGALREWVAAETESREQYTRLAEAALRHEAGQSGLWADGPELQSALKWWGARDPNEAWARRYNPAFRLAESFLRASEEKREADRREEERRRLEELEGERIRRQNARLRRLTFALVLFAALAAAGTAVAVYAFTTSRRSEAQARDSEARSRALAAELEQSLANVTSANDEANRQRTAAEAALALAKEESARAEEAAELAVREAAAAKKAREDLSIATENQVKELEQARRKVLGDVGSLFEQAASVPDDDEDERREQLEKIYLDILKVYEKDKVRVGRFSTFLLLGNLFKDDAEDDETLRKTLGYYDRALALLDANDKREREKKIKTLLNVGDLLYDESSRDGEKNRAAAVRYEEALGLGYEPAVGDSGGIYHNLSTYYNSSLRKEDLRKALDYNEKELALLEREMAVSDSDDRVVRSRSALLAAKRAQLISAGAVYRNLGDAAGAERQYEAAMEVARQENQPLSVFNTLVGIALSYDRPGEVQEREQRLQKVMEFAKTNGQPNEAAANYQIGGAFVRSGKLAESLPYLERADALYRSSGAPSIESFMTLYSLGYVYQQQQMKPEACAVYERALQMINTLGSVRVYKNFVESARKQLGCGQ